MIAKRAHLGSFALTRRNPDGFVCSTLVRAYQNAKEPLRSMLLLAAVGIFSRPEDDDASWPVLRRGEPYDEYGERMRAFLAAHGIDMAQACTFGIMAVRHATTRTAVDDKQIDEYADFFGVILDSGSDASSPPDTKDQPSED